MTRETTLKSVAILALLFIVVAGGLFFTRSRTPIGGTDALSPLPGNPSPHQGDARSTDHPAGATATASDERTALPHSISLLDSTGKAISGAVLTWTELDGVLLGGYVSQDTVDWEELQAATLREVSDEEGRVTLPSEAVFEARSVIWVTHPSYSCAPFLLDAGASPPSFLTMQEAAGVKARVTRVDARPTAGAIVTQVQDAGMLEEGGHLLDAVRVFRREYVVGTDGTIMVDPLQREQGLRAIQGTLQSERWWGPSPDSIELLLGPTFTVLGTVHADLGIDLAQVVVSTTALDGNELIGYDRRRASAAGTWGPATIPSASDADALVIRAEAPGAVPSEVSQEWPAPNARVSVEHHLEKGIPITVRVTDTEKVPLSGATAVLSWLKDERWVQTYKVSGTTGIVDLGMCPPGTFYLQAYHDDYGSAERGPLTIAIPSPDPFLLEIERPGAVRGRVLHRGEPVVDFTVCYQTTSTEALKHKVFEDRSDGGFEIEEAPRGDLWVFAFADELPQSDSIKVSVGDEPAEVTLELPSSLFGRGSVVDEVTREPLAEAVVEARVMSFNTAWLPRGPPLEIDAQGAFHRDSFSPGSNTILVSAPGYAQTLVTAFSSGDEMVDFGVIGLGRRQPLEVRLTGALDRKCLASIGGVDTRGETRVPESGVITFEEMSPGTAIVQVVVGAERTIRRQVDLVPGRDWIVDFNLSATPNLTVEVIPEPGEEFPLGTTLGLIFSHGGMFAHEVVYLPQSGVTEVWRPEEQYVVVQLASAEEDLIGYARVAPAESHVRIRLDPRSARFVVRHDGQPVSGAVVTLLPPGSEVTWKQSTSSSGEAAFAGITSGVLFVSVEHAVYGFLPALEIDFDEAVGEGMVLDLDVAAEVEVRFVDQGVPLAGLPVSVFPQRTQQLLAQPLSDQEGVARFGPIADGSYRVLVSAPSIWPVEQIVEARAKGASPTVIEVRRRADLHVALNGPTRGRRSVRLQSLSSDGDPMAWLQAGMIVSSPANMLTDDDGRLRIGGLPHGKYRWTVELPSGDALTGEVTLPPAAVEELRVVVP